MHGFRCLTIALGVFFAAATCALDRAHAASAPVILSWAPMSGPVGADALSSRVLDAAAAFDDYTSAASGLGGEFGEPGQVARAVHIGAGYEPHQLEAGAVAYAALVALCRKALLGASQRVAIPDLLGDSSVWPSGAVKVPVDRAKTFFHDEGFDAVGVKD